MNLAPFMEILRTDPAAPAHEVDVGALIDWARGQEPADLVVAFRTALAVGRLEPTAVPALLAQLQQRAAQPMPSRQDDLDPLEVEIAELQHELKERQERQAEAVELEERIARLRQELGKLRGASERLTSEIADARRRTDARRRLLEEVAGGVVEAAR